MTAPHKLIHFFSGCCVLCQKWIHDINLFGFVCSILYLYFSLSLHFNFMLFGGGPSGTRLTLPPRNQDVSGLKGRRNPIQSSRLLCVTSLYLCFQAWLLLFFFFLIQAALPNWCKLLGIASRLCLMPRCSNLYPLSVEAYFSCCSLFLLFNIKETVNLYAIYGNQGGRNFYHILIGHRDIWYMLHLSTKPLLYCHVATFHLNGQLG